MSCEQKHGLLLGGFYGQESSQGLHLTTMLENKLGAKKTQGFQPWSRLHKTLLYHRGTRLI